MPIGKNAIKRVTAGSTSSNASAQAQGTVAQPNAQSVANASAPTIKKAPAKKAKKGSLKCITHLVDGPFFGQK